MYRSLEYIIITSCTVGLASWTLYRNVPGEQHKGLCHFNTEENKKKTEIIPSHGPSPNPNPNCKHKALANHLATSDC